MIAPETGSGGTERLLGGSGAIDARGVIVSPTLATVLERPFRVAAAVLREAAARAEALGAGGSSSSLTPQAIGGLPASGITGDLTGAAAMLTRMLQQAAIDGSGPPPLWAVGISEPRARGIIPVTAGVRLLAGVIMQMPLRQYRGDQEIDPPAAVISNPAPADNGTLAAYVDGYTGDIAYYGNHVCLIGPPDSTGWPASLIPLDVTQVSVARDDRGRLVYDYSDTGATLGSADVLHVALDRRSGELVGRGLIPTMGAALAAVAAAEEYAGRYFDESAIPTGVITDNRPDLTQTQADELKAAWLRTVGARRRTPIVLPSSTTFTPLVTDADKAQLVEARQWNAQLAAMALGIPPFLLGVATDPHTYTNSENEMGRLVNTTIMRIVRPLEQIISLQLLPRGNDARFDTKELLRPEMAARAKIGSTLYAAGIITEGEAREYVGFPAEGGPGTGPNPGPVATPAPAVAELVAALAIVARSREVLPA